MPRSKGQTSQSSSSGLGLQLDLLGSGILGSASMGMKVSDLTTMLQSSDIQNVYMACQLMEKDGKRVVQFVIRSETVGDWASFMSALSRSTLPSISQGTSPKK